MPRESVLIVKLGALGDFIQSIGPMRAIRAHHKDADITLLTGRPLAGMAALIPYVDRVHVDPRPGLLDVAGWLSLKRWFREQAFARVYDLQNNDRTTLYHTFLFSAPRPEWVGVAPGASHRNLSPSRTLGTAFSGHVQTLALADVNDVEIDRLEWMGGDTDAFGLPERYALLVPGCAPQHPEKRWPPESFAAVAGKLLEKGVTPVLIGTDADRDATGAIAASVPGVIDLTGRTALQDLAGLARRARLCIGNDTGPMHLMGVTGVKTISLFSTRKSNPQKHAPLGENVTVLAAENMDGISVAQVVDLLEF